MDEPRFCETGGKKAVFLGGKTGSVLFCVVFLVRFENDFGNKILGKYVYIFVLYAVYELCLTLDGVRIFIWLCY